MVGVPGRSKACNTCKLRRVACSLERPECRTCIKASRVCAGYQRERIWILDQRTKGDGLKSYRKPTHEIQRSQRSSVETNAQLQKHTEEPEGLPWGSFNIHPPPRQASLNISPSSRSANRQQIFSNFLSIWPGMGQFFEKPSSPETMGSWLLMLPTLPDITTALEASLLATCTARLGRFNNDPVLVRESLKLYTQGLRELQKALWDPKLMYRDETAAACMLLIFYEVYECPDQTIAGWLSHMKGCAKLFELKGPNAYDSEFGHQLFLTFRLIEIQEAITERRPTFLVSSEWMNSPFKHHPKTQFQKFLDIMALLPNIIGDGYSMLQRPIETLTVDPSALFIGVLELTERCWSLDAKLRAFYEDMERDNLGPLHWPELAAGLVSTEDETNLGKVFPVAFQFQNLRLAHLCMLYWASSAILWSGMSFTYRLIAGFQAMAMAASTSISVDAASSSNNIINNPLQDFDITRLPPLEHRANVASLARNICQSLEYCLSTGQHGLGKTMSALPIKVAIETFHDADGCERELAWATKAMEIISGDGARIMGHLGIKWTDHAFLPG